MKRIISSFILLTFLFTSTKNADAQLGFLKNIVNPYNSTPFTLEGGLSVGMMNCMTDLGGKAGVGKGFTKDLNGSNNKLAFGLFGTISYQNAIAARLEWTRGNVAASDEVLSSLSNKDIAYARYSRGLNFQSSISEFSLLAEIHPLPFFINWSAMNQNGLSFSPYLLGGVGYFSFNPKATLNGELIDLQPLHTEGQGFSQYPDRKVYSLKQINFPVGLGVKYKIPGDIVNIRAEFVYRFLRTDYLDDCSTTYINSDYFEANGLTGDQLNNAYQLSDRDPGYGGFAEGHFQRGNPSNKDSYFSFNLKVGVNITALTTSQY